MVPGHATWKDGEEGPGVGGDPGHDGRGETPGGPEDAEVVGLLYRQDGGASHEEGGG